MFPNMTSYARLNCLGHHYKLSKSVIGIQTHSIWSNIIIIITIIIIIIIIIRADIQKVPGSIPGCTLEILLEV